MASSETAPIWSVIGKISVVVGLTISVFTVFHLFWPDAPSLECDCRLAPAEIRTIYAPLRTALDSQRKAADKWAIEKLLTDAKLSADSQVLALSKVSSDLAASIWPPRMDALVDDLNNNRAVADCTLTNTGSKQATDVVFRFPFEIAGVKTDDALLPAANIATNNLKLGTIKPGETNHLYVWSKSYASPLYTDDYFLLTSAEGTGRVRIAHTVYGWPGALGGFFQSFKGHPVMAIFVLGPIAALIILIGVGIWQTGVQRGYRLAMARYEVATSTNDSQPRADGEGNRQNGAA